MKFNPEQLEAINHEEGPLLVSAGAGSGKTRCIVVRIAKLVNELDIDPKSILATTFTAKAAGEMNKRLSVMSVDTNLMSVQTMHSFCNRLLQRETYNGWELDDENKYTLFIKQATGFRGMKWRGVDISLVEAFISLAKNYLVRPEQVIGSSFEQAILNNEPFFGDTRYAHAYFEVEELRRQRRLYTFDDMLIDAVELLDRSSLVRERVQKKYQWLIVDEFQDTNLAQVRLAAHITAPQWNFMVVGDVDQCQPAGTKVQTRNGVVPIESLSNGDEVKVWNRHASRIIGHEKIKVASRKYDGNLYTVTVNNYSTRATDTHRWFVRWNREHDVWVTYIMFRKDRGYRIGWCKLFTNKSRTYHLAQRARLEKADQAWILSIHSNPQDASIEESIVAARYGIPTAMFEPTNNAKIYTEEALSIIFAEIFNNARPHKGVLKCFNDYKRDIRCPLYQRNKMPIGGKERGTIFITQSCNLISELMSVPTQDNEWSPIVVTHHPYTGKVYSLDVNIHSNYIADGIVTHNCIYEWRGAVPAYMVNFKETFEGMPEPVIVSMGKNYRSAPNIVSSASKCIANNQNRITKDLVANKTKDAIIRCHQVTDLDEEANLVADEVQILNDGDGLPYGSMFVLYRTNAQSRAIEEVFQKRKIPHVVLGSSSFYQRKEIQDLLAYLKLLVNPNDVDSGERAINRPFRYISKEVVMEIVRDADARNVSFEEACESAVRKTGNSRIDDFLSVMRELRETLETKDDPAFTNQRFSVGQLISQLVKRTDFIAYLTSNEGSDTMENSREANVGELIRSADRYADVKEFIDFVKWQIAERKKKKKRGTNSVTCMTFHKAKGLEARAVFMIGVNEGILPHAKAVEPKEEERRLYYVGMTRAMEFLYITCIEQLGMDNKIILQPSRFIEEAGLRVQDIIRDGSLFAGVEDDKLVKPFDNSELDREPIAR